MMATETNCKSFVNRCRTCLNVSVVQNYKIFEDKTDSIFIADMLLMFTGLSIDIDDCLPKIICSNCYNHLFSFYNFCLVAKKIDSHIRSQINCNNNEKSILIQKDLGADIKVESELDNFDTVSGEMTEIKTEIGQELDENKYSTNFSELQYFKEKDVPQTEFKIELKCDICQKKFKKLSKLNHHKEKHYSLDNLYHCNICSQTFKQQVNLANHLVIHSKKNNNDDPNVSQSHTNEVFNCKTCSSSFKSMNSLSAHMRKHVIKGRTLACNICAKKFTKISHMKRHELCHSDNHPFKCTLCPKTFIEQSCLNEHMNKHTGVKPHACPMCSKAFSQLSSLTNHLKLHNEDNVYLCPTCGKKFNSSTNLTQHMKRHVGHKSFACQFCPKRFISKGEMMSHANTHTGERAYTCDECNGKFTKHSSLVKHKQRHLGIKPHKCDVCTMKFSCKDHLKRHYRIHTGEKPYRCEMCNKAFTQSNDLVKHRRAHLGDKLYKCSQCDESFRLQTELRQHISQHYVTRHLEKRDKMETKNGNRETHPEVPIVAAAQFSGIVDMSQARGK